MSPAALVGLGVATALALALLGWPVLRRYPDDQGDGETLVLLPKPYLPSLWRTASLIAVFVAFDVACHALRGTLSPNGLYASAVEDLASRVVLAPSEMQGYFANFQLGLRLLVIGTMLALALTCRVPPLRRLLLVSQVAWYLLAVILVDATLTVVDVLTGLPVAPPTVLGQFAALAVGFVALCRMLYANFALPRPSAVPCLRPPRWSEAGTLICCTLAAGAVVAAAFVELYAIADPAWRSLFPLVSPLPFASLTTVVRSLFLLGVAKLSRPAPSVWLGPRPAIDVIIPAYNEEEVIVASLEAIDIAAAHHPGPVHVILGNDGSTDRTRELVLAAFAAFRHADGRVIDVHHGGKSATLNSALSETTSEIVVRIDADTLVDEWSLYHLPRGFTDPEVGLVEPLFWPRWRPSPIPRMRLFEELRFFGMSHRALQSVDGVSVVPGVFTAFRRAPAVALGGFTVGMNGEDGDFTLRMARLGWRVYQDPKVIVYEDVPPTYLEIREQRVRWDRATIHNQARHGIYRAGLSAPSSWFTQTRLFFSRTFGPMRLMVPFYLACLATFQGTYRLPILLAIGGATMVSIGNLLIDIGLATLYRKARWIPWALAWPIWQLCLVQFSAESWLSLPGRPASVTTGARPAAVAQAVVH